MKRYPGVTIAPFLRIGAERFFLAHAYDNKNTLNKKLASYRKAGTLVQVREIAVAEKTLYVVYVR